MNFFSLVSIKVEFVAEWLFHTTSKEVYLFKREQQKIEINKSAFKEGLGKEEDVKENVLFIVNPFVELQFSIDIDHNVSHFSPENAFNIMDGNFSNTSYMSVNLMIESRFKKERYGSREMENYKKWVEHITKDFRTAFEFKTLEK